MKCNLVNLFFIFLLGILFSCEENIISDTKPRIDVVTKSVDTVNSFSFIYLPFSQHCFCYLQITIITYCVFKHLLLICY